MSWGYSPVDFWHTHPVEFWWIAEQRKEQAENTPDGRYGRMSLKEVRERYAELEAEEQANG